jgi:hypothetical protein
MAAIAAANTTRAAIAFTVARSAGGLAPSKAPRTKGAIMPDPRPKAAQSAPPGALHAPVVLEQQRERAQRTQLRIADWITAFAGSMNFVYIHIAWFTIWMLFVESKPWPMLTLAVSLEAIFLSTFVMIGQNRQAAFQQAKADHDFTEQALELKTNTDITREIDKLTTELHSRLLGKTAGG